MTAPPVGAQLSADGHYWWDGGEWQLVAHSDTPASASSSDATHDSSGYEQSPEDIFSGSFIQELMASSDTIAASVVEELKQDSEMAATIETLPDEFKALIAEVVQEVLQDAQQS